LRVGKFQSPGPCSASQTGTPHCFRHYPFGEDDKEAKMGRGLLLWLIGVPIPVIILLWLFFGR
jgi:hypothetical protein